MQHVPGLLRGPQGVATHHQQAPADQGRQPALLGTVEGERHEQQFAGRRAHFIAFDDRLAVHAQRASGHGHALGVTGGAGGVDHVAELIVQRLLLRRVSLRGQLAPVQVQAALGGDAQALADNAVGQQQGHVGVADDPLQAFGGVIDVQRHIGRASLHHRVEGNDGAHRAVQGDAHPVLAPDTAFEQGPGQAVGLLFQLPVGQLHPVAAHCHLVCTLLGMTADQAGQVMLCCIAGLCVWLHDGVEQAERADCRFGVAQQAFEQGFEVAADGLHLLRLEMVQAVEELDTQAGIEVHRQVHRVVGDVAQLRFAETQAGGTGRLQAFIDGVVLEHDDAVEQRLAVALGPALDVHQRRVLVVAHFQVAGLQLLQPVLHRLCRVRGLDDRQGVDEQPQQAVGTREAGWATGHGGAEAHGLLAGVTLQQQHPGSLHQGVGGYAQALGLRAQPGGALLVPVQVERAVAFLGAAAAGRTGQLGGGLQLGQAWPPEGFAGLLRRRLQPADVVAVAALLSRQRLAGVALEQFTEQA
ncbi:hypothetical protein D3C81_845970 [compost metagenome]